MLKQVREKYEKIKKLRGRRYSDRWEGWEWTDEMKLFK